MPLSASASLDSLTELVVESIDTEQNESKIVTGSYPLPAKVLSPNTNDRAEQSPSRSSNSSDRLSSTQSVKGDDGFVLSNFFQPSRTLIASPRDLFLTYGPGILRVTETDEANKLERYTMSWWQAREQDGYANFHSSQLNRFDTFDGPSDTEKAGRVCERITASRKSLSELGIDYLVQAEQFGISSLPHRLSSSCQSDDEKVNEDESYSISKAFSGECEELVVPKNPNRAVYDAAQQLNGLLNYASTLEHGQQPEFDRIFRLAIEWGSIDVVRSMLQVHGYMWKTKHVRLAASLGRIAILQLLLVKVDSTIRIKLVNAALKCATSSTKQFLARNYSLVSSVEEDLILSPAKFTHPQPITVSTSSRSAVAA